MSESNDHSANSSPGEGAGPAAGLPHVESPSIAADDQAGRPAEARAPEILFPESAKCEPAKSEPAKSEPAMSKSTPPFGATRSTALVLTLPRPEEAAAGPAPQPAARPAKSWRFVFTPAARSMVAVLLGAAVGSAATAGLLYLNTTPAAAPADPTTFTAALGRIDRELASLRSSVEGSAKQANTQIAKIADRMDRVEKSQAETGTKLARTTESLDRLDRRLAANGASVAGDTTGSTPPGTLLSNGERTAALADPKRPGGSAQTAILEGWVLRDVFNGAAMIQTPRNGMLEVIPGDTLPGLGRIEGVRRQDGRWVVVTSRGLIVSR